MLIVSPGTSDLSQGTSRTKQSSHTTTGHHFSSFLASDGQEDGNTDVNAMQIVGPAQKENVSVSSAFSTLHSQQMQAPTSVLVQHNQLSVANNGQTAVSSTSSEKPFTFSYPSPAFNFYNCTNVQVHHYYGQSGK